MKNIVLALAISGLTISSAHAHHSNAASFTDEPATIEGYVDNYLFKNPHVVVYLNVTDQDTGKTTRWMAEGPAATGLRQINWNKETLAKGDYIRISGNAGRNNRPMVSLLKVDILDPKTGATIENINHDRRGVRPADPDSPDFDYPEKTVEGLPQLSGIWVQGGNSGGPSFLLNEDPVFTPVGQAIQDGILALNDPQYVHCEPASLVRQVGFTPHPVKITQYNDRVTFEYEEYAGERVIYLDDREYDSFDSDTHYRMGRYKAYYEGDALIIESDLLQSGWSSIFGYVTSEETTTVETYTRNYDETWGPSVHLSMMVNDPINLAEPREMFWDKYYAVSGITGTKRDNVQLDYEMLPVECQIPLTAGD